MTRNPANASFQKEESSLAVFRAPALRRSGGGMIPWVGYRCTFYLYMVDVFWIYYAHGLKFDSDRIHLLTNVDKCFVAVWFGDYQPIIFFQCLKTISKICEILSHGPRDIIIWSLNLQGFLPNCSNLAACCDLLHRLRIFFAATCDVLGCLAFEKKGT